MDIDSQTDGANAVMSGMDSESESDVVDAAGDEAAEMPETQYMHVPEEELGEVSI